MRKLLTLFCSVFLGVSAWAQNPVLENPVLLRGGIALPVADFGQVSYVNGEKLTGGTFEDFNTGSYFEIGSFFYVDDILKHDKMKVGIDATFLSVQYNLCKYSYHMPGIVKDESVDKEVSVKYHSLIPALKLGLVYSYSPAENLAFDACIRANGVYAVNYHEFSYTYNGKEDASVEENVDDTYSAFNLKPSFEINARYSVLALGCEYRPGMLKYSDMDSQSGNFVETYKMRANSLIIKFGLAF